MIDNPFPVIGYERPEYFCDREKEVQFLLRSIENKRNSTLFANRKIGKTGLIQHLFHLLSKKKNTAVIYLDILGTSNLKEFVTAFAGSVIGKLDAKAIRLAQKATKIISLLRPKISYDTLTGEPEIVIDIATEKEAIHTLEEVFKYLKERSKKMKIVIAIDEFQQVLEYPEKNPEALLRSKIQLLPSVSFIFSGSQKHLLMEMFADARRPFYQSTDLLELNKIPVAVYAAFIKQQFKKGEKKISDADILFIQEWTRNVTFYVQSVCNRLFYRSEKNLSNELIKEVLYELIQEREASFFNYRSLLAQQQWNLLVAIAKEDGVREPSGFDFIHRHKLGANSSVRTALKALLERELVIREGEKYFVYDVFFSRWLARL
jgi:hypothetical protein